MATATLYFYSTSFKTKENCIYDDLETYFKRLVPLTISNFQYFKVTDDFDRTIKIESSQSMLSQGMVFGYNYLKVVNSETGNIDYYYVTGSEWTSQYTIQVNLYFDVLNSLRSVTKFSDKTHITRRFKDRWEKYVTAASKERVRPLVDEYPETIDTPPQKRKRIQQINGKKWHLVYRTEYDSSNVANNPVSVYALPDDQTNVVTTTKVGMPDLKKDTSYYITNGNSAGFRFDITYYITGTTNTETRSVTIGDTDQWVMFALGSDGESIGVVCDGFSWRSTTRVSDGRKLASIIAYQDSKLYKSTGGTGYEEQLANLTNEYLSMQVNSTAYNVIPSFNTWYQANKTDSKIVKILALPYAPFTKEYSGGYLKVPAGWRYWGSDGLRLEDPTTKFQNNELSYTLNYDTYLISSFKKANRNDLLETKLLNSQFSTKKFVYDSNNWVYLPEYLTYDASTSAQSTINISVNFATEMSSNIAFKFDAGSNMKYDTDYGEWMTSTRDLEVPFYTNEYLNYIRYGESYDWNNIGSNLASAGIKGIGSTITTAVTMGVMGGGPGGAAVGAAVGAITTVASLALSAAAATNSINAKIAQYKTQASSASTNNDLSIFTEMTSNQLQWMEYEPVDELKSAIARYFDYFGYATDEYGQMTDSRHWNDFYIAEVDFAQGSLLTDTAKEYIKQAYSEGVRIYHYDSGYDIDLLKNNYEKSLE